MRSLMFALLLGCSVGAWAQSSSNPPSSSSSQPNSSQPSGSQPKSSQGNGSQAGSSQNGAAQPGSQPANTPSLPDAPTPTPTPTPKVQKPIDPTFDPPRSDRVNASNLGGDQGDSSSKDTQIDLDPPADDAKTHPNSAGTAPELEDVEGVAEFRPWDPHKAAKDIEIGDFYFKQKNYKAAESRYREALYYKDNDAIATYRLAICLEKLGEPADARSEYQSYLKILPHGPEATAAQSAIDRLTVGGSDAQKAK